MKGVTIANRYLCSRGLRPCFGVFGDFIVCGTKRWPVSSFDIVALEVAKRVESEMIEGENLSRHSTPKEAESDTYRVFLDSERVKSISRQRSSGAAYAPGSSIVR